MSRQLLPFHADDISALARALRGQIVSLDHPPGHVELLNMLARASGWRNFQHLRAQWEARQHLEAPPPPPLPMTVDHVRVRRTARHFDESGRLVRWPGKHSERQLCLWVLWSRLPAKAVMTEVEVNQALTDGHSFGDYALLRRWLCDWAMMTRTADGREYRRAEVRPPPEALALLDHLKVRAEP